MFKTSVVSLAIQFAFAQLITACGFSVPDSQTDLPLSHQRAIAQELVNVGTDHLEDVSGAIYLYSTSGNDWLQVALTNELVERRYRISDDPNSSRRLAIDATRVGTDSVHVSLAFDNDHVVRRLFQFDQPNDSDRAFHVDHLSDARTSYFPVRGNERAATKNTAKPDLSDMARTPIQPASLVHKQKVVARLNPPAKRGCLVPVLQQGSLKRSIERILTTCRWQLTAWPKDPTKPNHELDWLVPTTQRLELSSIEDLVEALRGAFDLDIELNHTAKTVRVQLRT